MAVQQHWAVQMVERCQAVKARMVQHRRDRRQGRCVLCLSKCLPQ
jgi:hypothetical protein